jgi:hypothetical protein
MNLSDEFGAESFTGWLFCTKLDAFARIGMAYQSKQLSSTSLCYVPGVDGLVVMTWAFHARNLAKQAYNPGSNPGRRIRFLILNTYVE